MRRLAAILALCATSAQAGPAEEAALTRLLSGPAQAAQFAPSFLSAVPLAQIEGILAPLRAQIGAVDSVTVTDDRATITTATHRMAGRIALDGEGRIAMLLVEPPVALAPDPDSALADLLLLADTLAWAVVIDGQPVSARGADTALPVASAFKLGVLRVLKDDVASGARGWTDVVRLEDRHRSLPTGSLQDFPAGSPFTLHTLAAAMIAQSDNTATDLLIDTLGRARVAAALDLTFVLTTREMFALKADPALADRYRNASMADRAAISAQAAGAPLPPVGAVLGPFDPQIEWPVSPAHLCDLLDATQAADIFILNPGLADPADWDRIASKGGSQPGVLSLATWAEAKGRTICLAALLNHSAAIDEQAAFAAYGAALHSQRGMLSLPD